MEFGALYDLRNPVDARQDRARLYAETLDHVEAVEAMGLDAVWVTEHHFIDDEYLPSCLTFAAAIAARTTRVTIGTAVLLLPLHDPLRVAEDAAVVDILSNGRLRLGLGLGYKLEEFEAFGIGRSSRVGRMEEGVAIIRGAWSDEPLEHKGRWFSYPSPINVTPKPVQRPGPQIWLAGRTVAPALRAARIGDGLIATPDPDVFAAYKAEAPVTNLCTFAFQYPTDDPDRAAAELGPAARYRMDNYARWYGEAGDTVEDRDLLGQLARTGHGPLSERDFFATADEVIAILQGYEAMGVTSLLFFAGLPGRPMADTLPFFEMLAERVMPAFR